MKRLVLVDGNALLHRAYHAVPPFTTNLLLCLRWYNRIIMKVNLDQIKKRALPILKEEGATRAALFGSVVRGEATENSDIDILVDLPRGKSLFDLAGLQMKLTKALGSEVDVVTYNSLNPLLKDYILKDQLRIL
ncbi:MAG: nucleotidyltransferase domain-containing protein [Candidatus Daviesbacteria bacterium]|nr:nucleotidyltransferase domain-containing protein [Candidatus Daviesbacteria bacterium]